MSQPTISAFSWVPPFAQGLVRDLRARWALEEAGLGYEVLWRRPDAPIDDHYRSMQPFGQVPIYREDGLVLFESGAIVLHVARRSAALWPSGDAQQAQVITWLFAAMNSIEPFIQQLAEIDLFHAEEAWAQQRRPGAEAALRQRLQQLAAVLAERDYLVDGRFTVADLLMTTVLRILRHTELVSGDAVLGAYVERCQARPAFARALTDHLQPFGDADKA